MKYDPGGLGWKLWLGVCRLPRLPENRKRQLPPERRHSKVSSASPRREVCLATSIWPAANAGHVTSAAGFQLGADLVQQSGLRGRGKILSGESLERGEIIGRDVVHLSGG